MIFLKPVLRCACTFLFVAVVFGCDSGGTGSFSNLMDNGAQPETGSSQNQPGSFNDGSTSTDNSVLRFANCDGALPCDWRSLDQGVELSLVNAYSDPLSGALVVQYTLRTTRDTDLRWLSTTNAIDTSSQSYEVAETVLVNTDERIAEDEEITLLAGVKLAITQKFRENPAHGTRSIARLTLAFLEGGIKHRVAYLDVPLDAETGVAVDCQNSSPCIWESSNSEFSVSVISADGLNSGGRLIVRYEIEANEDITIRSDAGSVAVGNDGTIFIPKIHTLGEIQDFKPFDVPLFANSAVSGSQIYFRNSERDATKLKQISLKISQLGAPQAGMPEFVNVPLN